MSVPLATGEACPGGEIWVSGVGHVNRPPRLSGRPASPSVSDGSIAWLDERFRLGDVALLGSQPQCQNGRRMKQWTSP